MTRNLFLASALVTLMTAAPGASHANDIVDFLQAVSGPSRVHRHGSRPVIVRSAGHRGRGHLDHGFSDRIPASRGTRSAGSRWSRGGGDFGHHHRGNVRPIVVGGRSRTTVSLQIGGGYPVVPPPPIYLEPAPAPVYIAEPPARIHELGSFVTCPVPLEPHVLVRNAHEIAPGAIPVVIAVRNPHLGRFGSRGCVESVVYVQVFVPPCPLQRLKVSPCRTRIKLDYGDYDVEITSCDGHIDVEYDD